MSHKDAPSVYLKDAGVPTANTSQPTDIN